MPSILIVDDNPHIRKSLHWVFGLSEFTIHEATNGLEALAIAERQQIDLVLSDVEMSGMSGIELCQRLRARDCRPGPPLPIWLMTGAPSPVMEDLARKAGARALLTKPFDPVKLLADIDQVLSLSAGSELESNVSQP